MKTLKSVCALVSIIVGMASTTPAFATSTETQFLGTAENAMDIWTFSCPSTTISAAADVADLNPPNNVSARLRVMLIRSGGAALAEDLNPKSRSGEGGGPSPKAVLAKKKGLYVMLFYKSALGQAATEGHAATGVEAYRGSAVCNTPRGPVDPALRRTQNQ